MKANVTLLKILLERASIETIEEISSILSTDLNLSDEQEAQIYNDVLNEFLEIKDL